LEKSPVEATSLFSSSARLVAVEKQWVSARRRKAKKVTKHGSSSLCLWVPDPETFPAEIARRNYTVKKRVDAAKSEKRRKSDQSMLKRV
jgi:hypothetical protein